MRPSILTDYGSRAFSTAEMAAELRLSWDHLRLIIATLMQSAEAIPLGEAAVLAGPVMQIAVLA